ncbi:MAG: ACP S-malonyltransferase [Cyanobacteria bacterium SBLK]|nr:ACP S-malonyltransferase [Cyanobacteria bacterium SBLK]
MNFPIDYNLTGDAVLFWGTLSAEGWLDLLSIRFLTFQEIGLPMDSSDRVVWQFTQTHQMILITANRNMKGNDSLEQTIREENTPTSLPILTVSNPDRLDESSYRQKCVTRLIEILLDLENYRGVGRIFIP